MVPRFMRQGKSYYRCLNTLLCIIVQNFVIIMSLCSIIWMLWNQLTNQLSPLQLVHLEVNPMTNQWILLTTQPNTIIVVQLISRINALLPESLVSNVTKLVIMPLCTGPAVPVLHKIQGNSTGFMVEAEHPGVEDSLQENKLMKQLRSLSPRLMRNLI